MSKAKQKKAAEASLAVLEAQTAAYQRAEITLLLAEETRSKIYVNLLTLIELVPAEQAASPAVGDAAHPRVNRSNAEGYTFYVVRITDLTVAEALGIYAGAGSMMGLPRNDVPPLISITGTLTENPPAFQPLLVNETDRQLWPILPHRHTAIRVWSRLNMDKSWTNGFSDRYKRQVSELSRKYLNYDLNQVPEHLGNVYLFGCNPVLRSWDCRLADYQQALLFRFNERQGQSLPGCKLVLEEVRGDMAGFYLEYPLSQPDLVVTLPYFPDRLHVRIFDRQGCWIDHSFSGWVNFAFDMGIHDRVVDYKITTSKGTEEFSVAKRHSEKRVEIGTYDWTAAHFLRDALASRRFQDLAESKEFVFFPQRADSLERAKRTVRELLNSARHRCMILDPYFGAADMVYIYHIENISLTVKVISSAAFLDDRPKPPPAPELPGWRGRWQRLKAAWRGRPVNTATSYLESLHNELLQYAKVMPLQKIECRVLRGRKSPLHDRFLVIDDQVYLLGSSLNEFGSRTTTIIRVPAPAPLIEQAEAWWSDNKECPEISAFLAERRASDVAE